MRRTSPVVAILKWTLWFAICCLGLVAGIKVGKSPLIREWTLQFLFHKKPADVFQKDATTILAIGLDLNYSRGGVPTTKNARSDVLMVARLDFKNNRATMISIPRDTYVRIPGFRRLTKINAAMAYGGAGLAKQTVEEVLGIDIDKTVVLNFGSFEKLVNEVGGVWVNVDKNMDYDDDAGKLHIHLKKGLQLLNGYKAMGYSRFRHSDSDFYRNRRQQQLVLALLQSIKSQPTRIDTIAESVRQSFDGLDAGEMAALANWGRKLDPKLDIKTTILPTHFIGRQDFAPDDAEIARILDLARWPRRGSTTSFNVVGSSRG